MIIMTYSVYSKDRKSLQFPAYCDGYVRVAYADAIAVEKTGLWKHSGGITVEMLVTPYDVNGNSDGYVNNIKTLGSITSSNYLAAGVRTDSFMTIFKNTNMSVSLKNVSSSRKNNPAKYKIQFKLTIGATTTTLTSDMVIDTSPIVRNVYSSTDDYLFNNHEPYAEVASVSGVAATITSSSVNIGANTFNTSLYNAFPIGIKVYDNHNNYMGTVQYASPSSPNVTVENITETFTKAFTPIKMEATYLEVPHHIAVSYDNTNKIMSIIYNNKLIKTGLHGSGGDFQLDGTDIYLGQDPNLASVFDRRKSQFIGEYHEIAITSIPTTKFININTLTPMYRKLLLYLDFEEANLNG